MSLKNKSNFADGMLIIMIITMPVWWPIWRWYNDRRRT